MENRYEITICKSENNTWFVIAFCKKWNSYGVVYEGYTKKECQQFLKDHGSEIRCA